MCASETKMVNAYILQPLGCNSEERPEVRQIGLQAILVKNVCAATVKSHSKSPSKERGPDASPE